MRQIVLKYTINGAKFKAKFPRGEFQRAAIRAQVLKDNGIAVTVRGMPRRLDVQEVKP